MTSKFYKQGRKPNHNLKYLVIFDIYMILAIRVLQTLPKIDFKTLSPIELIQVSAQTPIIAPTPIDAPKIIEEKSTDDIENMIIEIWGKDPTVNIKEVIATAKHENGYQLRDGWDCEIVSGNTNGSEDVGIFMINSIHHERFGGKEALKDCRTNIEAGYEIYKGRARWDANGLNAWYSFSTGKYQMFM